MEPVKTSASRTRLAGAVLLVMALAPVYYVWACDWCGGVLFCYFWGLAVMGGGAAWCFRRNPLAGTACALLAFAVLAMSIRYVAFGWIWAAGAAVICGGIWNERRKHDVRVVGAVCLLFLAVGGAASAAGVVRAWRMMEFRGLAAGEVESVVLERNGRIITVDDREAVAEILDGLQDSYAYLPNHESSRDTWMVTLRLAGGGSVAGKVGNGTRAYADAVYIEWFGAEYQSRKLYRLLRPLLWEQQKNPGGA